MTIMSATAHTHILVISAHHFLSTAHFLSAHLVLLSLFLLVLSGFTFGFTFGFFHCFTFHDGLSQLLSGSLEFLNHNSNVFLHLFDGQLFFFSASTTA